MEKRCRDLPAQGLLNSLGAVVARGGGRRLGEQGGLGLGFLLPGTGLESRNPGSGGQGSGRSRQRQYLAFPQERFSFSSW